MELIGELQAAGEDNVHFHEALEDPETEAKDQIDSSLTRKPDEWWNEADLNTMGLLVTSRLKDTRIFPRPGKPPLPWCEGQSEQLYEEMGMCDSANTYVAVWMLLGNAAILTVSEVMDRARVHEMLTDGESACLEHRLKLVLNPIQVGESCRSILPATATDPKQAGFVQKFLGEQGSCLRRARTAAGIDYICLMIDFNGAGRLTSWALKNVGFREGHVLDLHVIDWPGAALFTSGRLKVTSEVLKHI